MGLACPAGPLCEVRPEILSIQSQDGLIQFGATVEHAVLLVKSVPAGRHAVFCCRPAQDSSKGIDTDHESLADTVLAATAKVPREEADPGIRTSVGCDSIEPVMPQAQPQLVLASVYGNPVPSQEAARLLPPGMGGLIWEAELHLEGDFKPRRPTLPVCISDFSKSLVRTEDGRWIFSGVLNGWPGLNCLELISIAELDAPAKGVSVSKTSAKSPNSVPLWCAEASAGASPSFVSKANMFRATLRMAPWSMRGWSDESPGYVWWYFAQDSKGPKFAFGENVIHTLKANLKASDREMPQAVRANLFAHRYALGGRREDKRERITYHAAVLLEWDHGLYSSVVELGPLNGIAARYGKSDWYDDKLEEITSLFRVMPPCLVMPWKDDKAEIRVADVEARNLSEFQAYVAKYTGHTLRFVDPQFPHSGAVQLCQRSQADVMRYLLNYVSHDRTFAIKFRSCQTFAADFYSFMTRKKGIEPFHPSLRKDYVQQHEWFLYKPPNHEPEQGD